MLIYTANDNSTKYLYVSKHFLTSLGISLGLSTYFWPMGMKVIYGSSRTRHLRNGVPLNLFFPPSVVELRGHEFQKMAELQVGGDIAQERKMSLY